MQQETVWAEEQTGETAPVHTWGNRGTHWFGEDCGCMENQQMEVCISALRVKVPRRVGWVQCMLRSDQGNACRTGRPADRRDAGGFLPTENMEEASVCSIPSHTTRTRHSCAQPLSHPWLGSDNPGLFEVLSGSQTVLRRLVQIRWPSCKENSWHPVLELHRAALGSRGVGAEHRALAAGCWKHVVPSVVLNPSLQASADALKSCKPCAISTNCPVNEKQHGEGCTSTSCCLLSTLAGHFTFHAWKLNHGVFPPGHKRGGNSLKEEHKESQEVGERDSRARWTFPSVCPMVEDLLWTVFKLQGKRYIFVKDTKWEGKKAWSKHQRAAYKKALWPWLG